MLCALIYWLLRRLIALAAGSLELRHNDVEASSFDISSLCSNAR